jgi:ABC-2 type transport system ATP-binding protein
MSQRFSLYDDLKVEENMRFFGGIYGLNAKACEIRMEKVLRIVGLSDRRHSLTRRLPGGLKQRLALGCAILHSPPLIFLDEPTSGVDPVTRRNFWALIYNLADDGVTVFVTTHYMEEAEYCNRIALINRGKLIALGSPAELRREHLKGRIYEIEVDDALAAEEAVGGAEEVLDAAVFGRVLHVRLAREVEGKRYFSSLLSRAGLEVHHLREIEPTLEDVFVALVAGKEGENP